MAIDPKYLTLDNLLQKRLFVIPEYQRAYSWETKQRNDLFNDITKLYEQSEIHPDRHHFMATIVCLKAAEEKLGTDIFETLQVVDGQQRLTTLIIILKALSKALKDKARMGQKDAKGIDKLLIKSDKRLILLQSNHDNMLIFRNYLQTGKIPESKDIKNTADNNLATAFKECEHFVNKLKTPSKLLDLLYIIKNCLSFIFFILTDEGSVYNTFEVLNSRGLEVDWLDKCKSMLMGIAFQQLQKDTFASHIVELHNIWAKIYSAIGIQYISGDEILRFAATLKQDSEQSRPLSSEDSINYFHEICIKDPNKIIEMCSWILVIAEHLKDIYMNKRLAGVTYVAQARMLALSIMLEDKWTKAEQDEALDAWERVTFRIFAMIRKDARTKVGEYTRLSWKILHGKAPKEVIKEILDLAAGEEYSIDNAIEALKDADCYSWWGNPLRYFLHRYEEHLASQAGVKTNDDVWNQIWNSTASNTIEHIRPQKWDAKGWLGVLGKTKEKVDDKVNGIGNLVLLPPGVNAKAKDKSFKEKKKIYSDHRCLRQIEEIINENKWDAKAIKAREVRLLQFARMTWK